jgi:hypothetical protein
MFLLHFPSARAAQELSGALPCEARTFLSDLSEPPSGRLHPECTALWHGTLKSVNSKR